jgi:AsmA family protein
MKGSFRWRAWWIWAAAVVLTLASLVPLLPAALDAGYFRPALIHYLEAHFDRPIRIEGALHLQLWSRHPRLVAQQVIVGNPPWVARDVQPPDDMARIGRLTLSYSAPLFFRGATLESVTLEDASVHLVRDADGRANWHRTEHPVPGESIPLIKELSAEGVHVLLDDARRHLQFDGVVTAQGRRQASQRLHIEGKGRSNGRTVNFDLDGDPLDSVRTDAPYAWQFSEDSSGSHATAHGTLPQPFNFDLVDSTFEVSGEDLQDLYYLAGVSLIHTGTYRLTGSIERRASLTRINGAHLRTGQSELDATISIDAATARAQINAVLNARLVRSADFGAHAADRVPSATPGAGGPAPGSLAPGTPAAPAARVFSDATFDPQGLRRSDTQLNFTAQRIEVGRMTLQSVAGQMKVDHGVMIVTPLTAGLLQGKAQGRMRMDANKDKPAVQASLRFSDLQLAAFDHKDAEPPVEGSMQARVDINGRGRSLHQVVATATGSVSAALPGGTIRAALAEIAGVDLRGLGLTLAHSRRAVDVRCAVAIFAAQDGILTSRSIVIDTAPVLIRGEGDIRLDAEELHLALRGQPKDLRLLRFDAPLLLEGTLERPSIAIQTHDSSVKLVDPGKAKDVDCAQLLAAARSDR